MFTIKNECVKLFIKNTKYREFPGDSAFTAEGPIPGWQAKIRQAMWPKKKERKEKSRVLKNLNSNCFW